MKQTWKLVLVIGAAVLALVVIIESFVRPQKSAEAPRTPPTPPEGALSPASAAYRPTEAEWKQYLKLKPLEVGDRAPVLTLNDHRGTEKTPRPQKPAMW